MQQPFFAEQADIEEDAIERAQGADGIGSVFQHARGPDGVRRLKEHRQRPACDIVVELLVVQVRRRLNVSCPQRLACSRRGPRWYMAFMVRGLLILSVEISEVSSAPGREVSKNLVGEAAFRRPPTKRSDRSRNIAPRHSSLECFHSGCSGSSGALSGSARRGRTRRTCRRDRASPDPSIGSRSDLRNSASGPISWRLLRRSRDWGRAAIPQCRLHSRKTIRPARFLPRAPIFTPGYFVSFSNGSGGQSGLTTRLSSQSPNRFGSGPVAFSKQGSLTSPR